MVLPFAVHWKEIGILLDVDFRELEKLEKTFQNDSIRCSEEMIKKWLQSDRNATKKKLLTSIKLATVSPTQISVTHGKLNGIDL